jgi:nucleotide-binding universal stress UspA family protein
MQRFKNILVVFDRATGSRKALDQAADLARLNGARLSLVICLSEFESGGASDQLQDIVVRGLRSHFDRMVEPMRARDLSVSSEIKLGRPFIQVIRQVIANDHDFVVKVAESGGHRGFLFSSTDLHLLRKCPRPLWLLRQRDPDVAGPVLAAIAPPGDNADIAALNANIVAMASSLAAQRKQALHVVQAWAPLDPTLLHHLGRPDFDNPAIKQKLNTRRERAKTDFDAAVRPFMRDGLDVHRHFVDGIPSRVIVDLAHDLDCEVAVMSTLNRAGVAGLLIGETAENVFRQIECSVLALKPSGFVSPVTA